MDTNDSKLSYGSKNVRKDSNALKSNKPRDSQDDSVPGFAANILLVLKLFIQLLILIVNPFKWKNIYQVWYYARLKKKGNYQKLLEIWSAKRPQNISGEVLVALQKVELFIELEDYNSANEMLKGLPDKIERADRDIEWKEDKLKKVKLYRSTLQQLAGLVFRKNLIT